MSRRSRPSNSAAPSLLRRFGAVAVAAVAVLAVIVIWRGGDPGPPSAEPIAFTYFDDTAGNLDELIGTPVVLNFWASWCPACVAELPAFAEVERRYTGRVAFIGMNMQEIDLDAARALAERSGVAYPLAHDRDGDIFLRFGGIAMPTTVLIAADGSVARVHAGTLFGPDLVDLIEAELLG